MLVLSRRENEKVVFANLGVSVEVLRLAGKVVRLGIQAPAEIQILREELADPTAVGDASANHRPPVASLAKTIRHTIRNRLNIASLGLQVLQRRLELGDADAAEATIAKIFNELSEIDAALDSSKQAESSAGRLRRRCVNAVRLIVEDNPNESELLAAYLQNERLCRRSRRGRIRGLVVPRQPRAPGLRAAGHGHAALQRSADRRFHPPQPGPAKSSLVCRQRRRSAGNRRGIWPFRCGRWFSKPVNARELVREMDRNMAAVPA